MTVASVCPEGYLFVSAAARELDTTDRTVRSLFDAGRLAGTRTPAGYRLVEAESVRRYRRHLSVSEAALRMGVSADTVRHRFDAGNLLGFRSPSGRRWVDPESLPSPDEVRMGFCPACDARVEVSFVGSDESGPSVRLEYQCRAGHGFRLDTHESAPQRVRGLSSL